MTDAIANGPENLDHPLLRHDIPERLVDAVLDRQRQRHIFLRFDLTDWQALPPNLRHFIAVTSFEAAPDDLFMREKVASALLGMVALLNEAGTNEKLEDMLAGTSQPEPGIQTEVA